MNTLDDEFAAMYQKLMMMQGFDNVIGSIFGLLYINPEPVAMEDIAKKTGYSLASISNKVKMLEQMGMISKTSKPGTRKIFLYVDKDMSKMMKGMMEKNLYAIHIASEEVPAMIRKYDKKTNSKEDKKKVNIIKDYHKQLIGFEKIISELIEKIDKI